MSIHASTLGVGAERPKNLLAPSAVDASGAAPGILALCLVWFVLTYAILDIADTTYRAAMLVAILTALAIPLAIQQLREGLDIFEPLFLANASLASMFLGRPLFDISAQHWYFERIDVRTGFDSMLLVALVGIIAFEVGYISRIPNKIASFLPRFSQGIDPAKAVRISILLFVTGIFLFGEYVRESGGIGFLLTYIATRDLTSQGYSYKAASGYLASGPLLWPPASMISFSMWLETHRRSYLWLTILILVVFFATTLGSGNRTYFIQAIFGIAGVWYIGRNKRPKLLLMVPVIVIGLFLAAYSRESRNANTIEEKIHILNKMTSDPAKSIGSIWSEDDAAMTDYMSIIIANIPARVSYGNFSTIHDIVMRATPRFLFPSSVKPDERLVYIFKWFFPRLYYRYTSGAAPSVIAELYIDNGLPSAVVGMFILGVILATAKPWFAFANRVLPAQLFYVVMPAYTVSLMRGGLPAFVTYMAITSIPIIFIGAFAKPDIPTDTSV